MRSLIAVFVFFFIILASCMKDKEFPIEPHIAFRSFTKIVIPPDSIPQFLILSVSFTDGDGDIGLRSSDTIPPYDFNLFIDIYKMINGQMELIVFSDTTVNFNGRIPIVVENPNNKPIEGVIEYDFDYPLLRSFLFNDSITFDVILKDRALHQSNIIRTPILIVD